MFTCLTVVALCLAPAPPAADLAGWLPSPWAHVLCRVLAGAFALAIGWYAAAPILTGRGTRAVRRFEWTPEGQWRLEGADGTTVTATLTAATATLGPWLLLAWVAEERQCRRFALIDVSEAGEPDFRRLSGRLRLQAVRAVVHR